MTATFSFPATPPSLQDMVEGIDGELAASDDLPADDGAAGSAEERQYIRFTLGDVLMAVPLASAVEIGRQPRVTPMPNLPGWVLGLGNIRGEIISMVDLKAFFGIAPPALKRGQRFIVVREGDMKVGLVVDRVIGIFTPNRREAAIRSYLTRREDGRHEQWAVFVAAVIPVNEEVLNILDVRGLLSSPRMDAFRDE